MFSTPLPPKSSNMIIVVIFLTFTLGNNVCFVESFSHNKPIQFYGLSSQQINRYDWPNRNHAMFINIRRRKFFMSSTKNEIDEEKSSLSPVANLTIEAKRDKRSKNQNRNFYNNPNATNHQRRNYRYSENNDHYRKKNKIKTMFREAKNLERMGRWRKATSLLRDILKIDPKDSYSHLALAKLEARREQTMRVNDNGIQSLQLAREAFVKGTTFCPNSIHLWQAWAVYEQELGNREKSVELFNKALSLDDCNPYVCHAFGLMEQRGGDITHARELWEKSLTKHSTAALVCSLGELYASSGDPLVARDLYAKNVDRLKSERERTEVYLAAAWLEERHFSNIDKAIELIRSALKLSPTNGRAHVALVRLEERREHSQRNNLKLDEKFKNDEDDPMRKRLTELCANSLIEDGRLFHAWASLEIKDGNLRKARNILCEAMKKFPRDQSVCTSPIFPSFPLLI